MNNFVQLIISNFIAVPVAFLVGYKLRKYISGKRRFVVGFAIAVIVLSLSFAIGLAFPMISKLTQLVATATVIGFPLGLAGPPYNDLTRKNVPSKK